MNPVLGFEDRLAAVHMRSGRYAEAEPLLRESLALIEATLPSGHWAIDEGRNRLGQCLMALGRYAEAEPLLVESWRALSAKRGDESPVAQRARREVERLRARSGRLTEECPSDPLP